MKKQVKEICRYKLILRETFPVLFGIVSTFNATDAFCGTSTKVEDGIK